MTQSDAVIVERMRSSYEAGRLRLGLSRGSWPLFVTAVVLVLAAGPLAFGAVGLVLAVVTVWSNHRGQVWGAAARSGFFAGLIPVGLALLVGPMGHVCAASVCVSWCAAACLAGGGAGAALVAQRAGSYRNNVQYWIWSGVITTLTGSLVCACAGIAGLLALVIGYVLTMGPAIKLAARGA